VGGDVAALVAFSAIGRVQHGEALSAETLATALPFVIGWLSTAPFVGGYGPADVGAAALAAAKCWAAGVPLGLVLRGLSKGYIPPTPFIVVSFVATAVIMIGWRAALASRAAPALKGAAAQAAARQNKKGSPFEFIQLLMSLTKRW
jgi:hypothetical protein